MTVEDAQPGEVIQNFQYDGSDARMIAQHVKLLKEGASLRRRLFHNLEAPKISMLYRD
jgi:hypothetical protein